MCDKHSYASDDHCKGRTWCLWCVSPQTCNAYTMSSCIRLIIEISLVILQYKNANHEAWLLHVSSSLPKDDAYSGQLHVPASHGNHCPVPIGSLLLSSRALWPSSGAFFWCHPSGAILIGRLVPPSLAGKLVFLCLRILPSLVFSVLLSNALCLSLPLCPTYRAKALSPLSLSLSLSPLSVFVFVAQATPKPYS